MKVLVTAASFLQSYGGPAFSVSRLACALAAREVRVGLWAPDGSAVSSPILSDNRSLVRLGGDLRTALSTFGEPDIFHDNGVWRPFNFAVARLADKTNIPRIVTTRGMLEPWAMQHRQLKKKLAWTLFQRRDLLRARCLHATAGSEAQTLMTYGLGVPVRIVPNGVDQPAANHAVRSSKGLERKALFLSRLHSKKGLPMLVEAWARCRPKGWVLEIAGPDEEGHRAEVEHLVRASGLGDVVRFLGPVDSAHRSAVYGSAELFVLPTHSENFGMVIGEALAHGVPVLTTKGAPWPTLGDRGCGWWVDTTVDGIEEGLRQATACDPAALALMGTRGSDFVQQEFGWTRVAEQMLDVYEEVLTPRKSTA
ncbi:glycosyltransferase [Sulfuriferula sp.]|uniref:glycosyltransferase n=1 Tax=Sulfuriferula sp. TaxID=2025307 RepID=UPI00272FA553|nr:glycosyltransferase [Sulfuriferula sp.]MDP2024893.1 glycosyltransferase [Sulfuriferula sp.]